MKAGRRILIVTASTTVMLSLGAPVMSSEDAMPVTSKGRWACVHGLPLVGGVCING